MGLAAALLMWPVLGANVLGSADRALFDGYDTFSKNLVLAKIESTTPGTIAAAPGRVGLLIAQPIPVAPATTFDDLRRGGTATSNGYLPYTVQLGLQGHLFTALYHLGFDTISALETINALLTALALVCFSIMLGLIAPRSLAALFLVTSIASPWMVAAARNLYWVPWSFFLPAIAAIAFTRAQRRRSRWAAAAALLVCFALRFGMGFEFVTSVAILAAGMPVLAWAFSPRQTPHRRVHSIRDAATVLGIGIAAFAIVFVVTCWFENRGDFAAGFNGIVQHALTRTYGGTSTDPVTALSLTISPWAVLWMYVFDWRTNLFHVDLGTPFDLTLGPNALFPIFAGCALVILWRALTKDHRWKRDLAVAAVGLSAPLTWILMAKAHAFVHSPIDFVLWYLLGVAAPLWVVLGFGVELVRRVGERYFLRQPHEDGSIPTAMAVRRSDEGASLLAPRSVGPVREVLKTR